MTSHGDPVFPCGTIEAISVLSFSSCGVGEQGGKEEENGI